MVCERNFRELGKLNRLLSIKKYMKRISFVIIVLICSFGNSQSNYADEIKHLVANQDKIKVDSLARTLGYKGGDRIKVFVIFKVNNEGKIYDIRARAPHKVFEEEAIRIVGEIPKLDPMTNLKEGESMKFTLPLTLALETNAEKRKRIKKEERRKKKLK